MKPSWFDLPGPFLVWNDKVIRAILKKISEAIKLAYPNLKVQYYNKDGVFKNNDDPYIVLNKGSIRGEIIFSKQEILKANNPSDIIDYIGFKLNDMFIGWAYEYCIPCAIREERELDRFAKSHNYKCQEHQEIKPEWKAGTMMFGEDK